jgi:hypothetical protein
MVYGSYVETEGRGKHLRKEDTPYVEGKTMFYILYLNCWRRRSRGNNFLKRKIFLLTKRQLIREL